MGEKSFCMFTSICFNFLLNISSSSSSSLSWCDEWKTVNPYHILRQYAIFDGVPVPLRSTFILYISDKFLHFSQVVNHHHHHQTSHTLLSIHLHVAFTDGIKHIEWKWKEKQNISSNHNLMSIQTNQIGCTQSLLTQFFIPTDSRGVPSYARKPLELSIIFAQVSALHSSSWVILHSCMKNSKRNGKCQIMLNYKHRHTNWDKWREGDREKK